MIVCILAQRFGQSIIEIILRFRAFSVALAADIEKAFLMVGVSPRDRDVLHFLWIDDVESKVQFCDLFELYLECRQAHSSSMQP